MVDADHMASAVCGALCVVVAQLMGMLHWLQPSWIYNTCGEYFSHTINCSHKLALLSHCMVCAVQIVCFKVCVLLRVCATQSVCFSECVLLRVCAQTEAG